MNRDGPWSHRRRLAGAFFVFGLLFGAATPPAAARADDSSLVDALFSPLQLSRWSRIPNESERRRMETLRQGWLSLLKLGGREMNAAISEVGGRPRLSDRDFEKVLQRLQEAPLRVCTESCRCPASSDMGCVQVKKSGPLSAEVLFLHACALKPGGCLIAPGKRAHATEEMARILLEGAGRIMLGAEDRKTLTAVSKVASGALQVSFAVALTLSNSCPGPFPPAARSFLESAGFLRRISGFADQCAARMMQPLFGSEWLKLPNACREVLENRSWNRIAGALRRKEVEGLRCEGFCETLTCGDELRPVPRPLLFGASVAVSLPPDSCEGGKPLAAETRSFVNRALVELGRASGGGAGHPSSITQERLVKECRDSLLAGSSADEAVHGSTGGATGGVQDEASEELFDLN